ncbi:MAG: hypothetical protein H0V70_09100 [Ktedonobacteraceae bacterium]|nr:hypothetical protein [Ktedonobacteraceae bacterium]
MKQEHTEAEKTRKNVKEIQQPPHIGSIDTPELAAPTIETCTTERMTALKFKQQPILSSVSLEDLPTHRLIALHPANQENKASTINKPNVGERLAPKSVFFWPSSSLYLLLIVQ